MSQLNEEQQARFTRGRALFDQLWVASPSLDTDIDGLGPTFNQSACSACHTRNGRGAPPDTDSERMRGMLVRLSLPGAEPNGTPIPHPVYGDQLQDNAILGVPAEGRARVTWIEHTETFADGESITLRRPDLILGDLAFGEPEQDLLLSPRVAPSLVGMGLLDAVPDAFLEALAQEPRPDGISGRVNRVWNAQTGTESIGRFGWKANMPTLAQQTAGAFLGDMGLTSTLYPDENCPEVQLDCIQKSSGETDVTEEQLRDVVFYQAALAVPAPGASDTGDVDIQQGRELFMQAGCQHCHIPELQTGAAALPVLSNRAFSPYTDLLLHDMGEGLADGRPDFLASGSEWRTPPLWGLGLVPTVNEHNTLLHDGRARGVMEAIMWHGGEAEPARARVKAMTTQEREKLVHFIESL
ncbi:MAG: c-type cytochrome [Pseudomonadales bacterium]|nr:c-type cytochrome [Pseudomonadales bacterium]